MDQAQFPTFLALAMNAIVVLLMIASFFRRYATKDDIKDLNDRLGKLETGQTELKAGQAALESRFVSQEDRLISVEKKADASLDLHKTVHADLHVLQASVNRLDSYFETPKLKSS
ncbi:MAG: hypothetical protein OXI30_03075 [Chloroflexota bacterium]|nr:hypothetical protein [Chloroflexota bacterium]